MGQEKKDNIRFYYSINVADISKSIDISNIVYVDYERSSTSFSNLLQMRKFPSKPGKIRWYSWYHLSIDKIRSNRLIPLEQISLLYYS